MLRAIDISIRYGTCDVVRGVSMEVSQGEIVALIGPNGAGKTSLLRALNGSLPLASGRIELKGRPLSSYSRREIAKRIAVVAQENETKFPITVREFVLSGRFASGAAFGWETDADLAAGERAVEACELSPLAKRMMNELSGGERQRVVLARALAAETDVLLLDEPTANLDLAHQAAMFRLVRSRCGERGTAAVVITHDLNLAARFADRIVMLMDGEIFVSGRPEDVLIDENVRSVFGVTTLLDRDPQSGIVRLMMMH